MGRKAFRHKIPQTLPSLPDRRESAHQKRKRLQTHPLRGGVEGHCGISQKERRENSHRLASRPVAGRGKSRRFRNGSAESGPLGGRRSGLRDPGAPGRRTLCGTDRTDSPGRGTLPAGSTAVLVAGDPRSGRKIPPSDHLDRHGQRPRAQQSGHSGGIRRNNNSANRNFPVNSGRLKQKGHHHDQNRTSPGQAPGRRNARAFRLHRRRCGGKAGSPRS